MDVELNGLKLTRLACFERFNEIASHKRRTCRVSDADQGCIDRVCVSVGSELEIKPFAEVSVRARKVDWRLFFALTAHLPALFVAPMICIAVINFGLCVTKGANQ